MINNIMRSSSEASQIRSSLLARASTHIPEPSFKNSSQLPMDLIRTLGDNSCPYIKKKNLFDLVAEVTAKMTIIRPQNKWLLAWHGLIMFIMMYYIFEIGLLWGYGQAVWVDELAALYSVNCIFIAVLIIDCFLSNIKAYYSHGLLVTHPRLIVKRYLRLRFYIDVLAIISIAIPFISGKFALNWIKALFLLKLYTVYEIDKQFIRVSELKISLHTFYLLSRLVLLLVLGSHYLGIWFYMIDYWVYQNNYYGPNTPNICWIYNAESYSQLVLLQPWYGQYLYTMYFSIGTMTTIAYGDITPLNPLETLYITVALIAYTLGFAYILSQILRILMEAQASKFEHTNNLLIVSNMMKNNMIKQKTQSKVKSYFEKVWKEEIYRNREVETELIQKLPHRIRNELYSELYYSFFISAGFFYPGSDHFVRTNFIVAIANEIREQRLVEDHTLYKQGQEYDPQNLNNHLFYFIKQLKKGKLKPSIELGVKDLVIQTVAEGNIGLEGFLTGEDRDHWARVILSVLVYQLPRKVLMDHIHLATEQELQNIFLITSTVYDRRCYICRQLGHNFKKCPYVTYQPDKTGLVLHYLRNKVVQFEQQAHNPATSARKQRVSYNTLIISRTIKKIKFKIKHKYEIMLVNKYYRQMILSDKKRSRNIKRIKDDSAMMEPRKASLFSVKNANLKLSPKTNPQASPNTRIQQPSFLEEVEMPQMHIEQGHQHGQAHQDETVIRQRFRRATTLIPSNLEQQQKQKQEQELTSSQGTSSQSGSSDESSVDLQNYLKQTEMYIHHLENFESNDHEAGGYVEDLEYDVAKEFKICYPSDNISQVIRRYNNPRSQYQRRRAETMSFTAVNKKIQLEQKLTDRELLLEDSLDESYRVSERSYSLRQQLRMHQY